MKEIIKSLLSEQIEGSKIEFSILKAKNYIKNYCHLKEVPAALEDTVIEMVIEALNYETSKSDVKSLTQGDTSVTYESKNKTTDDIFKSFNKRLAGYRIVKK